MKHYHTLNAHWQAHIISLLPPKDKKYVPYPMPTGFDPYWMPLTVLCNNAFSWTDKDGHWQGDKYNSDAMCICAYHRDFEE
jgi:hypothetical protein